MKAIAGFGFGVIFGLALGLWLGEQRWGPMG